MCAFLSHSIGPSHFIIIFSLIDELEAVATGSTGEVLASWSMQPSDDSSTRDYHVLTVLRCETVARLSLTTVVRHGLRSLLIPDAFGSPAACSAWGQAGSSSATAPHPPNSHSYLSFCHSWRPSCGGAMPRLCAERVSCTVL